MDDNTLEATVNTSTFDKLKLDQERFDKLCLMLDDYKPKKKKSLLRKIIFFKPITLALIALIIVIGFIVGNILYNLPLILFWTIFTFGIIPIVCLIVNFLAMKKDKEKLA